MANNFKVDEGPVINSSLAPELPGFYFDESKQKYFKISSNSFGIKAVVTSDKIAIQNEPKLQKLKKQNISTSLIDILITSEVTGLKKNRINYMNSCFKAAKPVELINLPPIQLVPDIYDMQTFNASENVYMLVNYCYDFTFSSIFLRFNLTDLKRKMIDQPIKVI